MTESAHPNPSQVVAWRPAHEQLVLQAAGNGLRVAVVRPGIVYGGSRGIVSDLLKNAMNGLIRVIGKGENHWPLVYDRDLADLYVRAATRPGAGGIYHANDEADETVNTIVEGIVNHFSARRAARADRRRTKKTGRVCRRAGARPDRPQPQSARARMVADDSLCQRECAEAAGRVPPRPRTRRLTFSISTQRHRGHRVFFFKKNSLCLCASVLKVAKALKRV
jgi:nucleoside-diphosphate-sugar epimerase